MAECCCHKLVPRRPIVIQVQDFDTSKLEKKMHKNSISTALCWILKPDPPILFGEFIIKHPKLYMLAAQQQVDSNQISWIEFEKDSFCTSQRVDPTPAILPSSKPALLYP